MIVPTVERHLISQLFDKIIYKELLAPKEM